MSPDPEDELIMLRAVKVADAAHDAKIWGIRPWYYWKCSCGERSAETDWGTAHFEGAEHRRQAFAAAALAALGSRLLPRGGVEEIHWRVSFRGMQGERRTWSLAANQKQAREVLAECRNEKRWPDPRIDQRTVHVWPVEGQAEWPRLVGPWLNVEEGG